MFKLYNNIKKSIKAIVKVPTLMSHKKEFTINAGVNGIKVTEISFSTLPKEHDTTQ